jgi:hypothetical protein
LIDPNSGLQDEDYFPNHPTGVLAIHPVNFAMSENIVPFSSKRQPYSMTNRGLQIELPLSKVIKGSHIYWTALLNCHYEDDFSGVIGLSLESTEKSFEFLRSSIRPTRYLVQRMKEAELRTIFIGKRPLKIGSRKSIKKCLIRVKSTQPNGYTITQLEGHNTELDRETMVLTMTLEFEDKDWQCVSSTIMFLDEQRNSSFVVIIAIRRSISLVEIGRMVNILTKPGDIPLDEWKGRCRGEKIDWDGTQEKEVSLNKLPHDSDTDSPLRIKASITKEEILNQWIDVLNIEMRRDEPKGRLNSTERDIQMRRDAPSGDVNSKKRDKFNILSYLT